MQTIRQSLPPCGLHHERAVVFTLSGGGELADWATALSFDPVGPTGPSLRLILIHCCVYSFTHQVWTRRRDEMLLVEHYSSGTCFSEKRFSAHRADFGPTTAALAPAKARIGSLTATGQAFLMRFLVCQWIRERQAESILLAIMRVIGATMARQLLSMTMKLGV